MVLSITQWFIYPMHLKSLQFIYCIIYIVFFFFNISEKFTFNFFQLLQIKRYSQTFLFNINVLSNKWNFHIFCTEFQIMFLFGETNLELVHRHFSIRIFDRSLMFNSWIVHFSNTFCIIFASSIIWLKNIYFI